MTVGRSTFPIERVLQIVAPREDSDKNFVAYNLCDGNTSQADIAKRAKLDKGNLSRALARWIEAGIVIRIGEDELPLHIYALSKDDLKERENKHV
jgi:predicted transcriptional regulator